MSEGSVHPPAASASLFPKAGPAPLLMADDLRIDVDGVPACDGITFQTNGEHVLILGAKQALFAAATGLTSVVRGALMVRGTPVAQAALRGVIAGAAMDPPTPPRWTVLEYVQWSARLAGVPAADARRAAEEAIKKLKLGAMAKTQTSRLVPHARRATVVAAAMATGADVIALEDPLGGLPDEIANTYASLLVAALADQPWIVFAPRVPLTSPLALEADEALIATASGVDVQGSPAAIAAAERKYIGRIALRGHQAHAQAHAQQQQQQQDPAMQTQTPQTALDIIAPLLVARGARVESRGAHLLFDLGDTMTTSDLMRVCDRVNVAVIELVPVSRALS